MGMMTRILRLWKADLHGVMDQLEDKALLLKQCLREMESSLQQKQQRLNQMRRTCEQIQAELGAREKEQQKLEADLALAVRKDKDDIARLLIRKRLVLESDSDRLERQLQQLEEEQASLSDLIQEQQRQFERLKIKCATYCQQVEQRAADDPADIWSDAAAIHYPSEEEVELELLRYKETTTQGGAQ